MMCQQKVWDNNWFQRLLGFRKVKLLKPQLCFVSKVFVEFYLSVLCMCNMEINVFEANEEVFNYIA